MADRWERQRRQYRPEKVQVLFVGESRPSSGRFFYDANSGLFRHTKHAFGEVYTDRASMSGPEFLEFFRSLGCYLEDLCLEPVNNLPPEERNAKRAAYVRSLSGRIQTATPEAVVTVMCEIKSYVDRALAEAELGLAPKTYCLPFPRGEANARRYVAALKMTLRTLQEEGVLP